MFANRLTRGRLESCDVWGSSDANVKILSAAPTLLRNRIFSARGPGVYVCDPGNYEGMHPGKAFPRSVAADSAARAAGNGSGGAPRSNGGGLNDQKKMGAAPLLEGNVLWGNRSTGIWVELGGRPTLIANRCFDHVFIHPSGEADVHLNNVFGSGADDKGDVARPPF